MPKKTRKAKIRASRRPISGGYVAPTQVQEADGNTAAARPSPLSAAPRSSLSAAPSRTLPALTFNYEYVYRDLRRIGLLALLFFVAMFVLWFLVEVQHIPIFPGIL
jgi:hypothetical protein